MCCNATQLHIMQCTTMYWRAIHCTDMQWITMHWYATRCNDMHNNTMHIHAMRHNALPCNTRTCHAILCIVMQKCSLKYIEHDFFCMANNRAHVYPYYACTPVPSCTHACKDNYRMSLSSSTGYEIGVVSVGFGYRLWVSHIDGWYSSIACCIKLVAHECVRNRLHLRTINR